MNKRHLRSNAENGFSLIEVLVAFVILSLSLGVLFQIFSVNLRNAHAIDRYTKAIVIADSRLALLGPESPIEPGETAGEEGEFSWRMTISRYEDESLQTDSAKSQSELYDVAVQVQWQQGEVRKQINMNTLRVAGMP